VPPLGNLLTTSRSRPLIVLSPHLDDAVMSIGGLIAREAGAGREVQVVTAYTSYPPRLAEVPPRFGRLLTYDRRREEDRRALERLGAEPVWLDFCERAVREPALPRFLGVLSGPPAAGLDHFRNLATLMAEVERVASLPSAPLVAAPLAIGGHVDHVELFLAAALVMLQNRAFDRFLFYEDVYIMSARLRRRHFLAARHHWPPAGEPALARPAAAVVLTGKGWGSRGPRVEHYLPALRTDLHWDHEHLALGGYERAKLEAMRLYPSQMKALGGYGAWSAMLRRWHAASGGAEVLWTASCPER
jgi:LmbE family N-acetylglucosaminyl deacetylase